MKNSSTHLISLEDVTEDLVIEYLCTHPEFFQRHEDILEVLYLPHPCAPAVSLIERQVQLLREKNQKFQQDMINTLHIAKANEALFEATKRLTISLLAAKDINEVLESIHDSLCNDLNVETVRVGLRQSFSGLREDNPLVFKVNNKGNSAVLEKIKANTTVCRPLSKDQKQYLYAEKAKSVASCAVIPLGVSGDHGLIAIGSRDSKRFHRDMDTLFLDYIGKICSQMLEKIYNNQ